MDNWKPKDSDVAWVKNLTETLNDGGTWMVPCALSIYTFYHEKKEYVLVGEKHDPTNQKTTKILGMLGWKEEADETDRPVE